MPTPSYTIAVVRLCDRGLAGRVSTILEFYFQQYSVIYGISEKGNTLVSFAFRAVCSSNINGDSVVVCIELL